MAIQFGRFRDGQKSFMNDKITKELVQMDTNSRTARQEFTKALYGKYCAGSTCRRHSKRERKKVPKLLKRGEEYLKIFRIDLEFEIEGVGLGRTDVQNHVVYNWGNENRARIGNLMSDDGGDVWKR